MICKLLSKLVIDFSVFVVRSISQLSYLTSNSSTSGNFCFIYTNVCYMFLLTPTIELGKNFMDIGFMGIA
jgi:hypothetical protein